MDSTMTNPNRPRRLRPLFHSAGTEAARLPPAGKGHRGAWLDDMRGQKFSGGIESNLAFRLAHGQPPEGRRQRLERKHPVDHRLERGC